MCCRREKKAQRQKALLHCDQRACLIKNSALCRLPRACPTIPHVSTHVQRRFGGARQAIGPRSSPGAAVPRLPDAAPRSPAPERPPAAAGLHCNATKAYTLALFGALARSRASSDALSRDRAFFSAPALCLHVCDRLRGPIRYCIHMPVNKMFTVGLCD